MKDSAVRENKSVRKGDKVMVVTGNDKGLVGEVLSRSMNKVTIRGVNVKKKHVKKSEQNPTGGIVEIEKPIHISNVNLCVDEEKPRKLKVSYDSSGDRILVYREGDTDVPFRNVKKQKD